VQAVRAAPEPVAYLTYSREAESGLKFLQHWYVPETGLWKTTGWWNAANAVTVLVNEERVTGTRLYRGAIANTFARNRKRGFLNNFYDDEGWWALAWLDAYDLNHEMVYLKTARSIFLDMTGGWDETCGGGIWWSKDRKYKNAIANELFLSVAAELAIREGGAQRLSDSKWAMREWNWFQRSGMINEDNLVNDGLTGGCRNNRRTVWTYNQGVILGGLSALARLRRNPAFLMVARQIADSALQELTDKNGILHDPCEPNCGADGSQFKGIFVRNLLALNKV